MRIIAGKAKGRKISVPKTGLRPLSDRARESLFNILMRKTPGSGFLDLFAGSGSVGLEALSRGAETAIFVEIERKAVECIVKNLEELGFSDRGEVFSLDAVKALKILQKKGARFDIIFLGAPYGSPELERALEVIGNGDLLKEEGVVVAEHRFKSVAGEDTGGLEMVREERYGETVFSFYRRAGNGKEST